MTDSTLQKHRYKLFSVAAVGTFMATFDGAVVNVALPTIANFFSASVDLAAWVSLSYSLTLVALIMVFGALAESKGYAFGYKLGFGLFIVGSIFCSVSWSIYALILSRVLQAAGTAMFAAIGIGLITEIFPENERGKAIGMIVMMVSAGFIIGPVAGGLLLSVFSWHSIFLINIPIGLVGVYMTLAYFKVLPPHSTDRKMRWAGALSVSLALVTAIFALGLLKDYSIFDIRVWGLGLVSLLSVVLFTRFESRKESALIGLDIFKNRQFTASVAAMLAAFASVAGVMILIPFYLERVKHLEPKQVAFYLMIIPVTMFIFSPLSGKFSDKIGFRFLSTLGVLTITAGLFFLSCIGIDSTTTFVAIGLGIVGTGFGIFSTPNSSALMGSVAKGQRAVTSGILATSRNMGISVGVAITTSLFAFFNQEYAAMGSDSAIFVASFHNVLLISVGLSIIALPYCLIRGNGGKQN
ncbi:MAG: MFS transporter [Candidatus Zixiibacteriota bacterium]